MTGIMRVMHIIYDGHGYVYKQRNKQNQIVNGLKMKQELKCVPFDEKKTDQRNDWTTTAPIYDR